MPFIKSVFGTFLDALFPVPPAERAVLSMDAGEAWRSLRRARGFPVAEACSIFAYKDERVWRLIWAIKYKKSATGAAIAAYALYRVLRVYSRAATRVVVVPMPITRARRRERGFNQCELIVGEIERLDMENGGEEMGGGGGKITDGKGMIFARDLLARVRHTSRQTLKDRAERIESATGIFAVNERAIERLNRLRQLADGGEGLKDLLVIVIDDVVTTGSTMRDAVHTLRRAGFPNTFGLSVAH